MAASSVIERSQIQWGLTTIPFAIRRTGRAKTVSLAIEGRGSLVVTAPEGAPLTKLNDIVRRKAPWVATRIRKVTDLPPPPSEREFVTGESVRYMGSQYRLTVYEVDDPTDPRIWRGRYEVSIPRGLDAEARRLEVRRRLVGSLWGRAERVLSLGVMAVCRGEGLEAPTVIVCEQKKRWGSCDKNGVLRLNWRIIQAPGKLIDYVLVHEVAHICHRNHDRKFWASVAKWMPDYEARKARLRELGPSLVW